ncbi:MAG TPA: HTTM domain-containing protein [Pirellulaceae bacterium]|nr:HTTM domain-containing protein [Pirellulaceae bacterium]
MSAPPYDLKQTLRGFAAAWRAFFWEPIDPRPCAWIRIGFAAMVLINLACCYPDLTRWYGAQGVLPLEDAQYLGPAERWTLFAWLPQDDTTLHVAFGIFAVQACCLLLGIASRFNLLCVLVWLISFQNRNLVVLESEDGVLRLIGWYLLLMPLDRALALDRWIWRKTPAEPVRPCAPLGLRLLQLQMCVIFLSAAYSKLPGEKWQQGTTLYFVARLDDYFGRFPVPHWLFETPWLVRSLTWSVLVIELIVPLLIWFKQTRRASLVLLLLFHLGNEYTMNLYMFHWTMLLGWSAFMLPADWQWLSRSKPLPEPAG